MSLKDEKYASFTAKLIPNIDKSKIIGVRIPLIRKYAAQLIDRGEHIEFLNSLTHTYHEENLLHVCIISLLKDFDEVIELTEKFLPHIDNWAVCDTFKPKCFENNKIKLYPRIKKWISSEHTYTKRFATVTLMNFFLDDDFSSEYLHLVAGVKGEDYYLKMAIAWFMATALAKQYDETVKIIENEISDKWIRNKTIQKAVESYRISDEKKAYLKTLKIK